MNMNRRGVVSADSLHLRKWPNGEIIGYLKKGDPVHVTQVDRTATVEWYRVKPLNKDPGWVAARYVALDPPDVEPPIVPVPDELPDYSTILWGIGIFVALFGLWMLVG